MKIKKSLNISGKVISLETPVVMGILNVTPDSFYQNSRHQSLKNVLNESEKMLIEGALILDIGGYSSRPGADEVTIEEEINRVRPVVEAIAKNFPKAIISIDTFRHEVASVSLDYGAHIINDISGGQMDAEMFDLVANWGCPYIVMHMRGTPRTMMTMTNYENLLKELATYFSNIVKQLKDKGVKDIILDPGFGFAKTVEQNYCLLKNLAYLKVLELPILAGISRKSMIYKKLEITSQEALNGTTVLNSFALMNGASILRVHDVKEAVETVKLFKEIQSG